jgi:hypothetical protein
LTLLARVEDQLGVPAVAEIHARAALDAARRRASGFDHSETVGSALFASGLVLDALGDRAAARTAVDQALAQLRDAVGDEAPTTREARTWLAES